MDQPVHLLFTSGSLVCFCLSAAEVGRRRTQERRSETSRERPERCNNLYSSTSRSCRHSLKTPPFISPQLSSSQTQGGKVTAGPLVAVHKHSLHISLIENKNVTIFNRNRVIWCNYLWAAEDDNDFFIKFAICILHYITFSILIQVLGMFILFAVLQNILYSINCVSQQVRHQSLSLPLTIQFFFLLLIFFASLCILCSHSPDFHYRNFLMMALGSESTSLSSVIWGGRLYSVVEK